MLKPVESFPFLGCFFFVFLEGNSVLLQFVSNNCEKNTIRCVQKICKKHQKNTKLMMAFKAVENKNPTKEPVAALSALETSLGASVSSPIKAPKKGPNTMPKGPKNKPIPKPILDPQIPFLLPPNFLVLNAGSV